MGWNERFMALGQRIRDARIARNEKQARFAARLGVSTATLAKLERGETTVSLDLLGRVLDLLGHAEDLDALLPAKRGIFDRLDATQEARPARKRARRELRKARP
jgi:transcriptional regulator with XRE-family HTH domain